MQSQVRFNRVPKKVPEGLGGFGAEPGQVQQSSGEGSEGSGEGLGGFGAARSGSTGFRRRFPEKVWEALVQSQVSFNRFRKRFRRLSPVRFRRRLGRLWCRATSGSTGFRRRCGRLWCREGPGEGSGRLWCRAGAENVPEKVLGIFVAGPGQAPTCSTGFPALGFAARFRKVYIIQIKRCSCWGYHRSLFFFEVMD